MELQITHTTRYAYDAPVSYALQKVRLRPLDNPLQKVANWEISVTGGTRALGYIDHYGNAIDLVTADRGVDLVEITASGRVETENTAGILGPVYGRAPLWHFKGETPATKPGRRIRALSKRLNGSADMISDLHKLSSDIRAAAPYQIGATSNDTTAEDALSIGGGVCQDHAQIFVSAARLAGLPARYVSGYLMMNDRVDQDASHAWAEVHVDDLGWVGFDVSNGYSPDDRYVRLAIGRDARDAAPVSGMRVGSGQESMIVSVQVQQ